MYNFLVKKGTTISFLVGLVVIAIFLIMAVSGLSSAGYDTGTDLVAQGKEAMSDMNFFNPGIAMTLGLIIIAVLAMLAFGVIGLIKFPKQGMRSIMVFGGLVILFFILRAIAPDDIGAKMAELREEFQISDGISSFINGGILTTLVLIGFAAVAMIFFEIRNAFK